MCALDVLPKLLYISVKVLAKLLGVVRSTTWFAWCTTWLLPENPFAPLGSNSNYDIHSASRLTQAIQCIYKDHVGQFTPCTTWFAILNENTAFCEMDYWSDALCLQVVVAWYSTFLYTQEEL